MYETPEELEYFKNVWHNLVTTAARRKWEMLNKPQGCDEEIWLEAEKELERGWIEGEFMGR